MGIGLSLRVVGGVARATLPTWWETLRGGVVRENADARLRRLGADFVAAARVDLTVIGEATLPDPAVYMSNHQSHTDIPILAATVPAQSLRFVAKAELFRVPFWGRAMRGAEVVEIDRRDHERAVASLQRAEALIQSGISVWIAPEGTRSADGQLGALKKGGFYLARGAGVPIVPVAIGGTRDILPKGALSMRPGATVRVEFGVPIETANREIEDLMAEVQAFLEARQG